eukprot:EG_transcript_6073
MLLVWWLTTLALGLGGGCATAARPSSADCTWRWHVQPLDHFSRGATVSGNATYRQRYCIFSKFFSPSLKGPVFFYTGNESPVEVYINNTGLMWELGEKLGALLVFAEHRYFGESMPSLAGTPSCSAYLSSNQALADFALLIQSLRAEYNGRIGAVVAFGGSYGGMLSAWLRMKYPHVVDGAIAASAPIWGFPLNCPTPDGAFQVISSAAGKECTQHFRAVWPLLWDLASTPAGQRWVSQELGLCTPLKGTEDLPLLLQYLQDPLFLLAEGQYAFPSNYLTFSVLGKYAPLPAWPLDVACGILTKSHPVRVTGNVSDVKYSVTVGNVSVTVDWNVTCGNGYTLQDAIDSGVGHLLKGLADAVAVLYNASGDLACHSWHHPIRRTRLMAGGQRPPPAAAVPDHRQDDPKICTVTGMPDTSDAWGLLCCNEGLNLVITSMQGIGGDLFWPPSVPRGTSLADLLGAPGPNTCAAQYAALGLPGAPSWSDPWSLWDDAYYGGLQISSASNIVFSNGLLDPWSAGGVMQDVSETAVAVAIARGGHHADLFFATPQDPPSVRRARLVEEDNIRQWILQAQRASQRRLRPQSQSAAQ